MAALFYVPTIIKSPLNKLDVLITGKNWRLLRR